ncbi:MAG TPA: hypothetical protein VEM95_02095 [Thermoplasmata archaeon]|nr:hypothetical protein [Thermoplasmata archaeon]
MRASPAARNRLSRAQLFTIVIVAVVLAATGAVAYVLTRPEAPLRILSIDISPDPAVPGTAIVVDVHAEGGSALSPLSVELHYASFFAGGGGGGGTMEDRGGGHFTSDLPALENHTEVWLFAYAYTRSQGPVFSSHLVFPVGTILRGGASGLAFTNVTQVPERPGPLDTVKVTARVDSAATITEVRSAFAWLHMSFGSFGATSFSSGGGEGPVQEASPGVYTTAFPGMGGAPGGGGFEHGTVWFYRLTAADDTGNVAGTDILSFTVA